MRTLNFNEISEVSGGRIRPSEWVFSGAFGAILGLGSMTFTAYASLNAVSPFVAFVVCPAIAIGFHAAYDILHEVGL